MRIWPLAVLLCLSAFLPLLASTCLAHYQTNETQVTSAQHMSIGYALRRWLSLPLPIYTIYLIVSERVTVCARDRASESERERESNESTSQSYCAFGLWLYFHSSIRAQRLQRQ